MRTFLTVMLFAALYLLTSCEDATNDYFLENPVSGSVLSNVKCVNGSISYIGFVVDNTEKYGARIMKITGCGKKIDKGFKDDADDNTDGETPKLLYADVGMGETDIKFESSLQ